MSTSPAPHAAPTARAKLHAALTDAGARDAYWASLGRFLRFETSKVEFDKLALAALGPHVGLHNDLILALLKDAQQGAPPEAAAPSAASIAATPMDVDPATGAPPLPRGFAPPSGMQAAASVFTPGLRLHEAMPGDKTEAAACISAMQPLGVVPPPSAPKLMLTISKDRQTASAQLRAASGGELTVDRAEEAQLNALHDRLLEFTMAYEPPPGRPRLQAVQPEAVSLLARAVKVVCNRIVVGAVLGSGAAEGSEVDAPSVPPARPPTRVVGADDVYSTIRQPTAAPWMVPPSQRAAKFPVLEHRPEHRSERSGTTFGSGQGQGPPANSGQRVI